MRKYKVDNNLTLVYISRDQYKQYKNAARNTKELMKYSFPFTDVRRDYFNDADMLICEFNIIYPSGLFSTFYKEGLDWFVELIEMDCENG